MNPLFLQTLPADLASVMVKPLLDVAGAPWQNQRGIGATHETLDDSSDNEEKSPMARIFSPFKSSGSHRNRYIYILI
jgi:hypothetical protein